jgi:single-strand DNA-binding protein
MPMLNNVVLIGRVCKEVDLRFTQGGRAVATIRLAVDRGDTDKTADFFDVVVWEKKAESVANYLGIGRLIAVQGRLQNRQWETQEGNKREKAEVVASQVKFLDKPNDTSSTGSAPQDDDPFA